MCLEHRKLYVGRRAGADDAAAAPHLRQTAKLLSVGRDFVDHLIEHFGYRNGAMIADESAVYAVALHTPFVLDHDRARHRVEIPVEPGITKQTPRERAIERSDRDGV